MEVEHRLAGVRSGVGQDPVTALVDSLIASDLARQAQQLSEQRLVAGRRHGEISDMVPRDDQDMDRRLRGEIGKGDRMGGFRQEAGVEIPARDPAKDAVWIKPR